MLVSTKCPHCFEVFNTEKYYESIGSDQDGQWWITSQKCLSCMKWIVWMLRQTAGREYNVMIHPKGTNRPPIPVEVPEDFAEDYREACLVLADSPKASAALSRRCLQHILREKAGVKNQNDLAKAIQEVVGDPGIPSDISASLDAVRNIGNFSVHPNKSTNTGEIVDVEPMEAEWCLETIEVLFDFYFVRPAELRGRKVALNEKLVEIGKPPIPIED